jgi:hypothetical protein
MPHPNLTFALTTQRFDEDYQPCPATRLTTNFANLARGATAKANLRRALAMIDNRFNALAYWDNRTGERYRLELDIVTVELALEYGDKIARFPMVELLESTLLDTATGQRIPGILGNNFSSHLRDYDFSILLPRLNKDQPDFTIPNDFGDLHGKLFRHFLRSPTYRQRFAKPPVICLSASSARTYRRTGNHHPVLGKEYRQDAPSLTDSYFAKMGLDVRYFMPPDAAAPLAFYYQGDLANGYTNLELASAIATMETFQKIYRPEIYNANSQASDIYRPSLAHQDYSLTQIVYDRQERSRLALEQGQFAEHNFITPHHATLAQWAAHCGA